ncbi:Tail completion protein [uncultured Caudovirales phage]|uniref:Tail completion protein n=1 Tax=uncultured Caudovirales phage TaxID=2100421 RepID=A0A6J5N2F8_9CAUD|nr:Tail completion protein [uncultured Caudovirales phage]
MADGFALAIQKGLRTALAANAGVFAIVSTRIYDEPPQNVVFPYLRFDEITSNAFDTDSTVGSSVDITIEANSRSASGRVEAVQMVEAVRAALHRQETTVTVTGFTLVELIFQTYSVTRDPDGRGYTAVIALQALLE